METDKKLDTFTLSDKFGLNETKIQTEAEEAARRRAYLCGYNVTKVVRVSAWYYFDIYGTKIEERTKK